MSDMWQLDIIYSLPRRRGLTSRASADTPPETECEYDCLKKHIRGAACQRVLLSANVEQAGYSQYVWKQR